MKSPSLFCWVNADTAGYTLLQNVLTNLNTAVHES